MPAKWFPPNPDDIDLIISAYDDGIGIRGIADRFDVSPRPIERIIMESGRNLRNRSEQQFARMGRTTAAKRKILVAAANAAKRGRPNSEITQIKMAAARCRKIGPLESKVQQSLEQFGVNCEQQFPIGKYNCDLLCKIDPWATTPSVAVEVWGGGWHFHGQHRARFPERTKYILGSGYSIAFLAIMNEFAWNDRAAENLITHIDALSRLPSGTCQYRMIWGDSDYVTIGSFDDVEKALVTPTVSCRNPATGRYYRVAR